MHRESKAVVQANTVSTLVKHFEVLHRNSLNQQNYVRPPSKRSNSCPGMHSNSHGDKIEQFEKEVYWKQDAALPSVAKFGSKKKSLSKMRDSALQVLQMYEKVVADDETVCEKVVADDESSGGSPEDYLENIADLFGNIEESEMIICSVSDEAKAPDDNARVDSSYFSADEDDEEYDQVVMRNQPNILALDDGYCTLRPISCTSRKINADGDKTITENIKILSRKENESEITLYKERTIIDSDNNVRMQTVFKISEDDVKEYARIHSKTQEEYIIDELLDTEKSYINSLDFVIEKYLIYFSELFLNEPRKYKHIFANIQLIYDKSKEFYSDLGTCGYDGNKIAEIFLKHEDLFNNYPQYCRNKSTSTKLIFSEFKQIVIARERELDDHLGLSSKLLKPIQRLAKYELLLDKLQKNMKLKGLQTDTVLQALEMIRKIARDSNDILVIETIEDNQFTLQETGNFIMKDEFKMISPNKGDIVLFLFANILIFTIENERIKERYQYSTHIVNKSLGKMTDDSLKMTFQDFSQRKSKKPSSYVLECKNLKVKNSWNENIDKILWAQLLECREINKKQYQNPIIPLPINQQEITLEIDIVSPRRKKKSKFFVSLD